MKKRTIRLAGIDLDGTLLNDNKQLCAGAAETIAAAAARGIYIVPITGRPFGGVPPCIRALPAIEYIICSNGAQILNAQTGEALFSCAIPIEKSRRIMAVLRQLGCVYEPFAGGWGYTEQAIFDGYMQQYGGTPLEEYVVASRRIIDCVDDVFEMGETAVDEFFVTCPDGAVRDRLLDALELLGDLQYCCMGDHFLEITQRGADKGAAMAVLCRRLGIDIAETVAFGDGDNDILLLKKAGLAVAMGNALPAVKQCADLITSANNDNGVCEILKAL